MFEYYVEVLLTILDWQLGQVPSVFGRTFILHFGQTINADIIVDGWFCFGACFVA
jgi:hypothetical protein